MHYFDNEVINNYQAGPIGPDGSIKYYNYPLRLPSKFEHDLSTIIILIFRVLIIISLLFAWIYILFLISGGF